MEVVLVMEMVVVVVVVVVCEGRRGDGGGEGFINCAVKVGAPGGTFGGEGWNSVLLVHSTCLCRVHCDPHGDRNPPPTASWRRESEGGLK